MQNNLAGSESLNMESDKPLITFALFAYNQEAFIREAIEGAFAQDYQPLEIILSDDASMDSTFEIMQRAVENYVGPHRVVLNRNSSNLNIGDHVNTVGRLASGELVVLAAGDDFSMPQRVSKLVDGWQMAGGGPMMLCSDFEAMDASSEPVVLRNETIYRGTHSLEAMVRGDVRVLGATSAVTADVFRSFPPMDATVRHEDRVLPFRALLLGGKVTLVDEKLVRYRVQGGVSRNLPQSAAGYLYQYIPTALTRTLPDARQRLKDIEFIKPSDLRLHNECLSTISDHEARIDFAGARGIALEMSLLRWLRRGARAKLQFGHYLKCRFFPIFALYYRLRYAA